MPLPVSWIRFLPVSSIQLNKFEVFFNFLSKPCILLSYFLLLCINECHVLLLFLDEFNKLTCCHTFKGDFLRNLWSRRLGRRMMNGKRAKETGQGNVCVCEVTFSKVSLARIKARTKSRTNKAISCNFCK